MNELIDILRAKSGDQENYLLKDHLKEAVRRVLELNEFINKNKDSFTYKLVKNDEIFEKLVIAAILHDLGKIDYSFQKKVFNNDEKESEDWEKLKTFLKPLNNPEIRYPRHEILSTIWSTFLIGNTTLNKEIRTAILIHHYNEYFMAEKDIMEIIFNYRKSVVSYLDFINGNHNILQNFLSNLFEYIQEEFHGSKIAGSAIKSLKAEMNIKKTNLLLEKINSHEDDISKFAEFYDVNNENPDYDFLVLLGFLRRCDYSSSGGVNIEFKELNKVFDGVSNKISDNIIKNNEDAYLWQKDVLKNVNIEKSLIFIAPTGSGKTEFALLWAEMNRRKLIYTLPLRVALNDLFSRFRNSKDGYFKKEFVDILHSTAFIEYIKEEKEGKNLDMDKMMTSTKMISSPILLTTPDQIFLTSLNYYGSDKVISVYPFSSIVIDEIQTYNEEMAAIIIKTLEIIHQLKGKLLIITATFPPYFEKFFKNIFHEDLEIVDVAKLDENTKGQIKNFNQRRHKIKVIEESFFGEKSQLNYESKIKEFLALFNDKNLFLVVNNVKKAINLFKSLENDGKDNIYLLHSRLIELEKSRRIDEIKNKIKNGEKVTVVATQIIEASVNLDFDAMITEISTVDSQIQRWGRIYRNRNADYDENSPNVVIFAGEKFEDGSLKLDRGTSFVYDSKVVEKTFEVLKEYENTQNSLNYEDERKMINDVFEREINGIKLKKIYEKEIEKTLAYLNYFTVEKKSQAQKLFRDIAGYKVVIPRLIELEESSDRTVKNIFVESIKGNAKSWKEIIAKIKEYTGKDVDTWELKKILYEYSINVPIYYEDKTDFWNRDTHEFRGFYIWNKVNDEEVYSVKEYGLDSILKKEDDSVELH
ncbi:CRISPR-associated helicase/endonuclease Cas3 [Methanobacterium formicicum]|jgi:CRISPR-associated endonuclease/helicase Cas3|uniref:CRISPR-associated nuclease/helicase Cas3 n=1 Tax=Methanobacterium formicicum TaxID=2162 RepID=A0A090I607_METFO|nr:CRISPR-associated helicase/endonuclease Cas3 [Methanobacterium formicicum]MDH2658714.1 CRISPR-associated helicase/endonuclease Cas3 [Methanobacterium formicicum]CEA12447.1 CRISPR-associated nuclease/helicase Cas3 [Methanobacterium formicicum]